MAAITTEGALDLEGLRTHLASRLPAYAQPLFLRIQESVTVTSTFKHHRSALIREGFDPATTSDPIYLDDPPKGSYVRLNQDHLKKIRSGAIRF
jgi:fatty-acyl-CoA synthase